MAGEAHHLSAILSPFGEAIQGDMWEVAVTRPNCFPRPCLGIAACVDREPESQHSFVINRLFSMKSGFALANLCYEQLPDAVRFHAGSQFPE